MNFRSVSITHECVKARGRLFAQSTTPSFVPGAIQHVITTFPCDALHTVLHNHSSHVVLQFLLTGCHLVTSCCNSCGTLSSYCFSDYCSRQIFILDVSFPILFKESKADASYVHFAGLFYPLPHRILSQGTHH